MIMGCEGRSEKLMARLDRKGLVNWDTLGAEIKDYD